MTPASTRFSPLIGAFVLFFRSILSLLLASISIDLTMLPTMASHLVKCLNTLAVYGVSQGRLTVAHHPPQTTLVLASSLLTVGCMGIVGLFYDSLAAYGFTNSLPVISQAMWLINCAGAT